jgi:hypothetical protein
MIIEFNTPSGVYKIHDDLIKDVKEIDGKTYIINAMNAKIEVSHHICDVYDLLGTIKNIANTFERTKRMVALIHGPGMDATPLPPSQYAAKLIAMYGDSVTLKEIASDLDFPVFMLLNRIKGA